MPDPVELYIEHGVRIQNLVSGVYVDKVMSIDEAYERYLGEKRPPKLLRMLRALWRVKNA